MEKDFVKTGAFKFMAYLVTLGVILLFLGAAFNVPNRTAEVEIPEFDTTALDAAVAAFANFTVGDNSDVIAILNEDDNWKDEAKELAIEELERRDYRELGRFLDIDEDDIDRVNVKDVTVDDADVDDKDATVTFELKVYWEVSRVDINHKEYIIATVTIEDGEVEDIDFEFD